MFEKMENLSLFHVLVRLLTAQM